VLTRKLISLISLSTCLGLNQFICQGNAQAQQVLENAKTVNGRIDSGSPPVGVNGGFRPGVEYTFNVEVGQEIKIDAITDEGSDMDAVLVVVPPSLPPIQLDQDLDGKRRETYHTSSAAVGGMWKVRVVSFNNKPGTYILSLLLKRDGLTVTPTQQLSPGQSIMKSMNLPIVPCGSPDIASIQINAETFCTSSYPKGRYVYNAATNALESAEISQLKSWGLSVIPCSLGAAYITLNNQELCVSPTLAVPAGKYTYNPSSNSLEAVSIQPEATPHSSNNEVGDEGSVETQEDSEE
jgi:hypothetical protein